MPTMTLNLDDRHDEVLDLLARKQCMTKSGVLRQALRLYQLVHERAKDGQQLAFVKDGKVIPLITPTLMLMPLPEDGSGVRDIHLPGGRVRHNVGSDNLSDEDRAAMALTAEQVDALNEDAQRNGPSDVKGLKP